MLYALAVPIFGILFIVVFAVPVITYGIYSVRTSRSIDGFPFGETEVEKQKPNQDIHLVYQDTLTEYVKSLGVVRGTLMLENRIKAYMNDGFSREEAVRRLAEDVAY